MEEQFIDSIKDLELISILYSIVLVVVGYFIARILSRGLTKVLSKALRKQHRVLLSRLFFYLIFLLFLASALNQLGFRLGVLLGAAGIFTVSLGFASQTAVSNIISGLFLIFDHSFAIGDRIRVNSFEGVVITIDFMSVKLRMKDNTVVRIPNEKIIKTEIVNITHFPIRRCDLNIGVAYKENLDKVKQTLSQILAGTEICLKDPQPMVRIQSFDDSAINLRISAWATHDNFLKLSDVLYNTIKQKFDEQKIEIPYPQLVISKLK